MSLRSKDEGSFESVEPSEGDWMIEEAKLYSTRALIWSFSELFRRSFVWWYEKEIEEVAECEELSSVKMWSKVIEKTEWMKVKWIYRGLNSRFC